MNRLIDLSSRAARLGIAALAVSVTAPGIAAAQAPEPDTTDAADAAVPDGEVIVRWNETAMGVLTPSTRPLLTQPFVVTAMHVAMYDAVVAIEGRYEPFITELAAPTDASSIAAAAAAAHHVLVGFLPDHAVTFDAALAASLGTVPDGPAEDAGVAVGEAAGRDVLATRVDDGTQSGPSPALPVPGTGVWQPAPPATAGLTPWLATARPYTMSRPDRFRPDPPDLHSRRYRRDLEEVRRVGGATSTERSAEETEIARFWGDQPIAQNQRTLRRHATALGWDIAATARLFAAVMTSEADALIACWDAKYHHLRWRPRQSVPLIEAGWTPLLGTPNHPEFPSAHGCLTGSLAHSLARVMGTDHIGVDIDAVTTGTTRHYATVAELVDEVGNARIWGGLHYRSSIDAGNRIAERVVRHNLDRNFRPTC
jgi:hypothetical protein